MPGRLNWKGLTSIDSVWPWLSLLASYLDTPTAIQKRGVYGGGVTPYGYLPQGRRGSTGKGVLDICEAEAKIVRLIFALYEQGYSQTAIAAWLNRHNIQLRKQQGTWGQNQVRRILLNEPGYRAEALFGHQTTDPEQIAHQPVLERRTGLTRTYIFGNQPDPLPQGSQVPDGMHGEAIPPISRADRLKSMTPTHAHVLLTLFALRDQGNLQKHIARIMNERGLVTPFEAKPWRQTLVGSYLARRKIFEAKIRELGVTLDDVADPITDSPVAAWGFARDDVAREVAGIARIKMLRAEGQSIPKIREQLRAEGIQTRLGAWWGNSSISRVLAGQPRRAEAFTPLVEAI